MRRPEAGVSSTPSIVREIVILSSSLKTRYPFHGANATHNVDGFFPNEGEGKEPQDDGRTQRTSDRPTGRLAGLRADGSQAGDEGKGERRKGGEEGEEAKGGSN